MLNILPLKPVDALLYVAHNDGSDCLDGMSGTGARMARVEKAALGLAEVAEDLIRDMEMITLNLPEGTKSFHELGQTRRAGVLARALRAAVRDARCRY
jgi:hypothetical protein